jgi:tRNA pseudouridine55 synthase
LSKLQTDDKEYIAEIQIGVETNTYDICGKCIARKPTSNITLHQIIEELTKLKQGDYWQVPPVYSAKRIQGKQLYKLAYSQQQIPVIKPQLVRLFDFQIIEFLDDILQVRLHVSKGFYIRSLAHDLGVQLDTGANLVNLKRTRSGEFTIENSISLEQLFSDN